MRRILKETQDKHVDADVLRINGCLGDLFACSGQMVDYSEIENLACRWR